MAGCSHRWDSDDDVDNDTVAGDCDDSDAVADDGDGSDDGGDVDCDDNSGADSDGDQWWRKLCRR